MVPGVLTSLTLLLMTAAGPLVVPSPTVVDLKEELGAYFSESLSVALNKRGVRVITSNEIRTLLGIERQKALLGCDENANACLAEISSALGAERVLQLTIARLPRSIRVTAKLIHSRGDVLATEERRTDSEDGLLDLVPSFADAIAETLNPTPRRLVWPWLVPGIAGVAGVALGVTGLAISGGADQSLRMGTTPLTNEQATALVQSGTAWQWVARFGLGLGGALLVTSAVLAFVGPTDAPAPRVSFLLTSEGAALSLGGTW